MTDTGQAYADAAEQALRDHNISDAFEYLSQATNVEPSNWEWYLRRGWLYVNADPAQYEFALRDYSSITELTKDVELLSQALNMRAVCYEALGRVEDAVTDLEHIRRLRQLTVTQYQYLFSLYRHISRYESLKELLDEAIGFYPDVATFYRFRGEINAAASNHAQAVDDYSEVIRLISSDDIERTQALYQRGLSEIQLQRYKSALTDLYDVTVSKYGQRFPTADQA